MQWKRTIAWTELALNALWLADPNGGPGLDEPPPDPGADRPVSPVHAAAPNTGEIAEPPMRAVNGFMLVSFLGGPPRRYYVGHDPAFIAEQVGAAKSRGDQTYSYCDKPGWADGQQITIPCQLVTDVRVQHLEPDLSEFFDDLDNYMLV